MSNELSRRDFLGACSAAACAVTLSLAESSGSPPGAAYTGTLCLFSKPLPGMDWRRLAQAAKSLGFGGIDLTVRRGGHVQPERAAEDLPKAVVAIREEGLDVPMITTELTSADDPAARVIFSTAAKLSIPFFKPGYYQYKMVNVRRELEEAAGQFRGLVTLSKQYGIQAGYHNHEEYIGAQVWDMASVIDALDPKWAGFYFDARHAVAEGGVGGWKIATNLVMPRLRMVAVRTFDGRSWRTFGQPKTVHWEKAWWIGGILRMRWPRVVFKAPFRCTSSTTCRGKPQRQERRTLSLLSGEISNS